jgi:hypothetical protein
MGGRERLVVDARGVLARADSYGDERDSSLTTAGGVREMSTVWALIEAVFADARKAEELLRDAERRRDFALDPENALSGFVVRKGQLAMVRVEAVEPRGSRAYRTTRRTVEGL